MLKNRASVTRAEFEEKAPIFGGTPVQPHSHYLAAHRQIRSRHEQISRKINKLASKSFSGLL
jgi:hypothetical protein